MKCVARVVTGLIRSRVGGGPRRSGDSHGRDPRAVATVLFRAASVSAAGGCALQGRLLGDRFRAGSPARSEGCKQGGALCPPGPSLPGRAARGGLGAAAALGSGSGGAPAPHCPRSSPAPRAPAAARPLLFLF